jgi:hypothetical protein
VVVRWMLSSQVWHLSSSWYRRIWRLILPSESGWFQNQPIPSRCDGRGSVNHTKSATSRASSAEQDRSRASRPGIRWRSARKIRCSLSSLCRQINGVIDNIYMARVATHIPRGSDVHGLLHAANSILYKDADAAQSVYGSAKVTSVVNQRVRKTTVARSTLPDNVDR